MSDSLQRQYRVSVVMPVYNEERSVATSIRRVRLVPLDIELICVDDGSSDGTRAVLERLKRSDCGINDFPRYGLLGDCGA
jgi:glycosyltransferase involved in cell wall biosynthesis